MSARAVAQPGEHTVVFIRHGRSEWNISERFTGWTDILLSEVGLAEGAAAGRRLAAAGYAFDEAHISMLRRSRQTVDTVFAAMDHPAVPVFETWRLNERHYGALQGMDKKQIFAAWGEERSRRWWRGYFDPPPALSADDPRHPRFDPRYADLAADELPASESLADCQRRTLPYWREVMAPRVRAGRRLLVVSHGNTLRGLVMHFDGLDAEAMMHVEMPPAVPLVYRFVEAGGELRAAGREFLE
jgi:2,3-bisphosphoglycerate-dependent phosphoglycerate mutase